MKSLFFILSLALSLSLNAQKKHTIELDVTPITNLDFFCAKVIDNRINKDNIGVVQKGMGNKKVDAHFPENFTPYMQKTLSKLLPQRDNSANLVFIFHEMNVSERTTTSSEKGFCNMHIEIARQKDSTLYSLGYVDSEIIQAGVDVTKKHSRGIIGALKDCVYTFSEFNWKDDEGTPINVENMRPPSYDISQTPPIGIYTGFSQLAQHKPYIITDYEFQLSPNSSEKFPRYILTQNGKKINRKILFVSDGNSIYMHASRYNFGKHYVKAQDVGQYIYFEDKYTTSGGVATGAAIGGLVGAGIASSAGKKKNIIILDTQTGKTQVLYERLFHTMLVPYPELASKYRKSKRKFEDKKRIFLELNALLINQ